VGSVLESTGGVVLGGDLTGGARWSATITVFGRAERVMRRNGARAGDGVWVTGRLGAARTAVQTWLAGAAPDPAARDSFVRPIPRLAAGQWLAAHEATAMMDLSDGLAGDAGHLAAASNVSIELELERVPVHPAVTAADPEIFAVAGGEDYELLVCLPAPFAGEQAAGVPLTRIGSVVAGQGVRLLRGGKAIPLPSGYNHFK
jgi:thiamine-monophosphate kinase